MNFSDMIHFRIFVAQAARPLCKPGANGTTSLDAYKVTCPACRAVLKQQRAS